MAKKKPTYDELEQRIRELEKAELERKMAVDVMRKSEERYRSFVRNFQGIAFRGNMNFIPIFFHGAVEEISGYTEREFIAGEPRWDQVIHPEDLPVLFTKEEERLRSIPRYSYDREYRIARKDGSIRWVHENIQNICDDSGKPAMVQGAIYDITERKQIENALREREEKYKSLTNNLNVGIYRNSVGSKGNFIEANPAIVKMFGFDNRKEFLKIRVSDLYKNPYDRNKFNEKILREGAVRNEEIKLQKKDGTSFIGSISAVVVKDEKDDVKYYDGIIEDITDRKRTEAALQESEQRYLSLLEANPDPVVVYDMEGKVNYFNPAFTRVFGWSLKERIGQKMDDFVPEENWPETRMMIKKVTESERRFSDLETCRYTKVGNIIPVSISGSFYEDQEGNMAGSVVNIRDISERKKLEAQFQQTQKMEAIGTLAGGIAHDFNNILSAIMGYTEISLEHVEKDTNLYSNLQEVFRAGKRAKDLVKHILTFSRQTEKEHKPVQVKLIAKEALKFLRSSLPTTIDIRTDIQSNSLVLGDPTQIHQILMNLCTNAGHAMLGNGGVLDVKLQDVELDVEFTAAHPDMKPGAYINLAVSDTGCGMPSQVLDQIFDPFFTTKKTGEGTGLGLSVVHGIVGSYGGAITAYSEPGQGSTFNVYLPVIEMLEEAEIRPEEPIPTGSECVLFIDDEPVLANLGKRILESLGYEVVIRNSSIEALELFKAQPDRFDLVITDMTMPHMTGDVLAGKLILIRPEIPVILCTGYSAKINEKQAMAMGIRTFVLKPFVKREIATKVREVLDGR